MQQKKPLLFLSFLFLTFLLSSSEVTPDALALLSFKASADALNILHFAGKGNDTHCQWPGVKCSLAGRVVRLVVEDFPLRGIFAPNTLARLDQLRVLSLQNDSLSGPLPDLSGLLNLKSLFLDHNAFSGNFPLSVLSLHRILLIDLSHNNLSGSLPPKLAALDRLYSLRLDGNQFTGAIPPLNQSSLKVFSVSRNNLAGPVPATALLAGFGASAFAGNPGLCGEVVHKQCSSNFFFTPSISPAPAPLLKTQWQGLVLPPSPAAPRKHKRAGVIILGFGAGVVLVIGLFLGVSLLVKKRQQRKGLALGTTAPSATGSSHADDNASAVSVALSESKFNKKMQELQVGKSGNLVFCAGEAPVYSLEQLMRASAEMLGRGSIATTYKAVLDNQLIVSVKRLDASKTGVMNKEAFDRHMGVVGNLRHPNLVPLRAFFQAKEERLLVYDYQPNGSLFSLIHGNLLHPPHPNGFPFHGLHVLQF